MNAIRGDADSADEVSEETRMLVAEVRERAAHAPGPEQLADLLSASRERSPVTPAEIRELGRVAVSQAQQVSYLMGRLAGLLGDGSGGGARVKG